MLYCGGCTNNCDGDERCVWEDEGDFFEFVAAAPLFGEEHPVIIWSIGILKLILWYLGGGKSERKIISGTYHPAPLSPNPWATIMVAVWRLSAGTINGAAAPAIVCCRQLISLKWMRSFPEVGWSLEDRGAAMPRLPELGAIGSLM